MSNLTLPEIFEKVRQTNGTIDEKATVLKKYTSKSLLWFVDVMYNAKELGDIQIPEYAPSTFPVGNTYMNFSGSLGKLEYIMTCKGETPQAQRNLLVILQNVHKDEAAMIVNLLQGKKVEGVSKAVFKRAFPQFFPDSSEASLDEAFE